MTANPPNVKAFKPTVTTGACSQAFLEIASCTHQCKRTMPVVHTEAAAGHPAGSNPERIQTTQLRVREGLRDRYTTPSNRNCVWCHDAGLERSAVTVVSIDHMWARSGQQLATNVPCTAHCAYADWRMQRVPWPDMLHVSHKPPQQA